MNGRRVSESGVGVNGCWVSGNYADNLQVVGDLKIIGTVDELRLP